MTPMILDCLQVGSSAHLAIKEFASEFFDAPDLDEFSLCDFRVIKGVMLMKGKTYPIGAMIF